jgi:hypothetical protein
MLPDPESFAEPEVAVAAVVVAAVLSKPVRRTFRRGVVYGLAGLLVVRDSVLVAGTAVATGAQQAAKAIGSSKRAAVPAVAAPVPTTA